MKPFLSIPLFCVLLLAGCGYDAFDASDSVLPNLPEANVRIAGLREFYRDGGATTFTRDYVIAGLVTASDESGNFYRSFFVEDETGGIEIKAGLYDLHTLFPIGRRVAVRLKGMTLGRDNGVYQLGSKGLPSSGYETDFLGHRALLDRYVVRGSLADAPAPSTGTIRGMREEFVGSLIRIRDLCFVKGGRETWAVAAKDSWNGKPSSKDVWAKDEAGDSISVYTSGYADFAPDTVPVGKVDVTGILLKNGKNYRLKLRIPNDVEKR